MQDQNIDELSDETPDVSLNQLKPMDVAIEIDGKEMTLRKITLDDENWIRETFGEKDVFNEHMTITQMCRIAFHQLTDEDKKHFAPIDCEITNDDTGETFKGKIGGWKLMLKRVSGVNEKVAIMRALIQNAGISRPMLEKMMSPKEFANFKASLDTDKKKAKRRGRK